MEAESAWNERKNYLTIIVIYRQFIDLIKTGESSATIEVHISNDGYDAYEFEKYGNRIIVIRHITGSGASTYKLKSASNNVVSTSRADLLKMILYMNIQVDNPVCVMTQDASRGFLRE